MVELANLSTENNLDFKDVNGIVYRDMNTGNLKTTPKRPLIKDLDSLPFPARHLVSFDSYGASKINRWNNNKSWMCL